MASLVCQPCQNDELSEEAAGYCVDCAEYLCVTCYKFHCKPQPCRHHVLLDKESMPQQPAQHGQSETCVKHKGKVLEYFCNNHDYIGCSVCMTLEHTTCEGKSYIPDIATSIPDSDEYKELQTSISGLKRSADDHIKVLKDSLHDTETIRDSVIADTLCFRQKLDEALDMLENVVRDEVDILTDKAAKERLEQIKNISDIKDEIERICSDLNMSITYRQYLKLFISVKSAKVMTLELKTRLNEFEKFEQKAFEFTPNLSILKLLNALETLGTVNSVRSETVSVKSAFKSSAIAESITSVSSPKRSNTSESKITTCKAQNTSLKELCDETIPTNKEKDNENIRTIQEAKSEKDLYIQMEQRIPSPVPTNSKEIDNTNLYKQKSSIVTSKREGSNKSGIGKYMLTYSDNEEENDEKTVSVQIGRHDETVTHCNDTKLNSVSVTGRDTASADRNYKADLVDKNGVPSKLTSNLKFEKEGKENKESLEFDTGRVESSTDSSQDEGKKGEEDNERQFSDKVDSTLSSAMTPEYGTNIDGDREAATLSSAEVGTKPYSFPEKERSVDEIIDDKIICHNYATTDPDTRSKHVITHVEENTAVKVSDSNEPSNKIEESNSSQKRSQNNAKTNLKNPKDRVLVFLKDIAVTSVEDSAIPTVCGMEALSDDRIAVCDSENKSIKLVDILTNIVVQTIKTDQSPWDVCEAGTEKIAVTYPFSKQIGIYKVTESVKKDYIFNVEGGCYGIAYANENLFVAFGDANVVKVMDLYGYVLRVLQNMRGEKPIFNTPKHITAGPEGRLFYVSNWGNDSITCLTALGHVAGIFTDRELKAPRDVAVDSFGLVYVCNFARPCGIQVLTKGLNKVKKLLHKDKAIANPLSLAYSYKGDWLFIGIKGEHLKMYKLTV